MDTVEGVARALVTEAGETNERRVLVVTGGRDATRRAAIDALEAAEIPAAATTYLGTVEGVPWKRLSPTRAGELLGTTRESVVLDCHDELRPNALGRAVGAVDGGGLLVLLAPPLDAWPDRRDDFDEGLAVPPFDVSDVTGHFRRRFVSLLRAHRGIAILDADEGIVLRRGLTDPPQTRPPEPPTPPADHRFPAAVYDRCRTDDQVAAVEAFEPFLADDSPQALVVEADRGRGKSSAAGLAAGTLALEGKSVLVTAPKYRNTGEAFARAREIFSHEGIDVPERGGKRSLDAGDGWVAFAHPGDALDRLDEADVLVVDEAAALPVGFLVGCLAAPAVAFVTTVHGYEGAGRGFSVRFRDRLAASDHAVTELSLTRPVRYSETDPVEAWAFRALALDASPAVDQLVADAEPATATYRSLDPADLLADEHLLREAFGLLVLAHYRTEPDDLARLLDAPNLSARALVHDGHVVSVALLAREGGLAGDLRAEMYDGARVRGNMIPDVLTSQLRDERAGVPVGQRVVRIATHPALRSRGLGSHLLDRVHDEVSEDVDWLGTGYGATPRLLDFWRANGFATVHLSTTRNERSGEYSAVMLRPTGDAGSQLLSRHAAWFCRRLPGALSDPLDDVDADVVRGALRSVGGTTDYELEADYDLALDDREWRFLAGLPGGVSIFETAPRPLRRLAVRYLLDATADDDALTAREERLLVRRVLQGEPWASVADGLDYHSERECKRALGDAVGSVLSRYGPPSVRDELERFE
ncbi:tRNA(Met) cytidine acetyltransferase [Halobacteriales archaeon QH_10_67_22]|nr:MAG: tRNA(Met) cytidine acetyltransferase [Halobacteriales archaeon QH_10_67_22]